MLVPGLVGAALLAQQPPASQSAPTTPQPPITFKVEINYVEVDAVVADQQGNFVRDLKKEDFQVFEDGKPQAVTAFAFVNIPVEREMAPLFSRQPIEPDVRSNERQFDGRVYLIALDDLHTHPLRSQRVKAAARQFIERSLGANDLAALVHTSGRTDASQEFTNNRRLLLAAVDRFMGKKLRSPTLDRLDEYYNQQARARDAGNPVERVNDPREFERAYDAQTSLRTLRNLAEYMNGIRGRRKALVYVSEGIDYDTTDVINNRSASSVLDDLREAIAAATRSNVSIYAVDPRGLTTLGDEAIEIGGLPENPNLGLGPQSMLNEVRLSQDSLRVLADETGGFAAVNSNDFAQAFQRIVSDNSSYYVLGYYPGNSRRDGRFRKIEVRLSRPGLQVRARKGYVAPRGKTPAAPSVAATPGTSAELSAALASPLPTSGLTIRVFAAPFKGTAPNASVSVAIEAGGRDLTFSEKDGKFVDDIEVSISAIDQQGKVRGGDRHTLQMGLRPDTHKRVVQFGFRTLSRFEVPPGRYQLRIAARESGGGRIGSVHYDLEVPDFSKAPFSMSGLVLGSAGGGRAPTVKPDPQFSEVLPVPPTTAREFERNDEIALFAEIYDNEGASPHKVDITATLQTDEGKVVFKNEEERASSELQGARGGYGYAARIPLRDVAPGLYVLKVEARSRLGDGATVARQVQIRVM